jgi:peptidase M23-like protein
VGISAAAGVLLAAWGPGLVLSLRRTESVSPLAAQAAERSPRVEGPLPVFARDRAVVLRLIAEDAVAVAFHEASRKGAETLGPSGVCTICRNRTKFRPSTTKQRDLPYIVMDSRGRPFPATSAVDIVVRTGTPILSPVTGTVRNVKRYRLYRRYLDIRVAIAPDADPSRRVVLIHLRGVTLQRGDRVEASKTVIGRVRSFPFESQVDRYVRGSFPHVHIEVRRGTEARSSTS